MALSNQQILVIGAVALGGLVLLGLTLMPDDNESDGGQATLAATLGDEVAADQRGQHVPDEPHGVRRLRGYDVKQHLSETPYEPSHGTPAGSKMLPGQPWGATDHMASTERQRVREAKSAYPLNFLV